MSTGSMPCLRCGGSMEQGFVADKAHQSRPEVQTWVGGAPERSFWTGLRLKDRKVIPVSTFRCEKCGYLESYASQAETT